MRLLQTFFPWSRQEKTVISCQGQEITQSEFEDKDITRFQICKFVFCICAGRLNNRVTLTFVCCACRKWCRNYLRKSKFSISAPILLKPLRQINSLTLPIWLVPDSDRACTDLEIFWALCGSMVSVDTFHLALLPTFQSFQINRKCQNNIAKVLTSPTTPSKPLRQAVAISISCSKQVAFLWWSLAVATRSKAMAQGLQLIFFLVRGGRPA